MAPMPVTTPSAASDPSLGEGRVHVVGQQSVFDERALIEQQVDALTDGQLAEVALPGDSILPAHPECGLLATPHVVDQRAPVVQIRIVGHRCHPFARATERTLDRVRPTGVATLVAALLLLGGACTDDTPPSGAPVATSAEANPFAPPASASPSDVATGRVLARAFADAVQERAPTRITLRQVDCLVDQFVAHLDLNVLSGVASSARPTRSRCRMAFAPRWSTPSTGACPPTSRPRCRDQFRSVSHRPFHCGLRFSANAAMPSAASSVAVVIVSIGCSSRSASSADWSHTA